MPESCTFNDAWLCNKSYCQWLVKDKTKPGTMARCRVCIKSFSIENMGEAAVKSHMHGAKHVKLLESLCTTKTQTTLVPDETPVTSGAGGDGECAATNSVSTTDTPSGNTSLIKGSVASVTRTDVLPAELWWTLKTVTSHYSYSSAAGCNQLFQKMFPDSRIAEQFQCGSTRVAYLAKFGLAPHFRALISQRIGDSGSFVLLFDESMNMNQRKQMDFHVRAWQHRQVVTRYYGSAFLGHATAEDMVASFENSTADLATSNMLQLSMDGPNVNWKCHRVIDAQMKRDSNVSLIDIGSCGLHIVPGAFKKATKASTWEVDEFLKSLFWLFKDTPARRQDFGKATKNPNPVFPLRFCETRWVENVPVVARALQIYPDVKKYVAAVESTASGINNPKTKSYNVVKTGCDDPLLEAKMHVYKSLATEIRAFLTLYQTDKPMLPFLSKDLYKVLKSIMTRFIKADTMKKISSAKVLIEVDLSDKTNLVNHKKVDVGFEADCILKELLAKKVISELQEMQFCNEARDFICVLAQSLLDKSPLPYSLTRNVCWLDPREMAKGKEVCVPKMKTCLKLLVQANRVNSADCDTIIAQFGNYVDEVVSSSMSEFKNFDPSSDRLDNLLFDTMSTSTDYASLWSCVTKLMLLSHGQASVERGFSVNRQLETENLDDETYECQRIICDHVQSVGGW